MGKLTAREVTIPVSGHDMALEGDLSLPEGAKGLVIFAHGSGSSRFSPRNRQVAGQLAEAGLATLLFDLLTPEEAQDRGNVFDIPLLARRVTDAVRWALSEADCAGLPIGLYGASTGAAAALAAAAGLPGFVKAVVSRGGRPDLAKPVFGAVTSPVLLIVGGADTIVIDLNEEALAQLGCEKKLEIVPGATHLFEEPGALDAVTGLAAAWFLAHFGPEA